MKIITLHSTPISVIYKNSLCSIPSLLVFLFKLSSVLIPLFFVTVLSPYSGISESRILFEQPEVTFQFKYMLLAEDSNNNLLVCSSFEYLNRLTQDSVGCTRIKFWQEDWNYDMKMDKANFQFQIEKGDDVQVQKMYLVLFMESTLSLKCSTKPPAVIIEEIQIPTEMSPSGEIVLKGQLDLVQNNQFVCPFYGRKTKSHFQNEILKHNQTSIEDFSIEVLRRKIKTNPGYFELRTTEKYFKKRSTGGLNVLLELSIFEVPVRFHLSIWERLGQFWLYFASFFGISFYVFNQIKDFLFSRHFLKAWEIIPWKKMY